MLIYVPSYAESVNVHRESLVSCQTYVHVRCASHSAHALHKIAHLCTVIHSNLTIYVRFRTIKLLRTFVPYFKRTVYIRTVYVWRTCRTIQSYRDALIVRPFRNVRPFQTYVAVRVVCRGVLRRYVRTLKTGAYDDFFTSAVLGTVEITLHSIA